MKTEPPKKEKIAILGGGVAGLSLGWLLSKSGRSVSLFEASGQTGGLARTFRWHNIPCDIAPHRLYTHDKELIGLLRSLTPMRRHQRNSRILMKGRVLKDPVSPLELMLKFPPSNSCRLVTGFLRKPKLPETSFEALAINRYGKGLYDFFFEPYTKKLFGVSPKEMSVVWGREKLRSSGLADVFKRRSKTFFNTFYYPVQNGFGTIAGAMEEGIRGEVQLNATVTRLHYAHGRVQAVEYEQNGKAHLCECDRVFSTIPITTLGKMFGHESTLRFRGVQLVFVHVKKPQVMPYHWVYFGDGDLPINRMAEFRNFYDDLPGATGTVLCAEVTSQTSRPVEEVLSGLVRYKLLREEDVDDTLVVPERFGYPVYDRGFEDARTEMMDIFEQYSNLHLVGRNAEFRHIELDEVLGSALKTIHKIYPDTRLAP